MSAVLGAFFKAYDLELAQIEERIRGLRIEAQCIMNESDDVIHDDRQRDMIAQMRMNIMRGNLP